MTRVGATEIEYQRADNINGPIYTISRSEVAVIVYANGKSDVISTTPAPVENNKTPEPFSPTNNQANEEPVRVDGHPKTRIPAVAPTETVTAPAAGGQNLSSRLGSFDVYSVSYTSGSGYSEYGLSLSAIGRKENVATEVGVHFQTGTVTNTFGLAALLTSPLKSRNTLIPFYRAGIFADYSFGKGFSAYGPGAEFGLGIAVRLGAEDKFIRFGVNYQVLYSAYNVGSDPTYYVTGGAYMFRFGFVY